MISFLSIIGPSPVTLSRSEGSLAKGMEMLRFSQHDRVVTLPDVRIIL